MVEFDKKKGGRWEQRNGWGQKIGIFGNLNPHFTLRQILRNLTRNYILFFTFIFQFPYILTPIQEELKVVGARPNPLLR